MDLEGYRSDIPRGRENAAEYEYFVSKWGKPRRRVREILHAIGVKDFGDGLFLIRSSQDGGGFYLTRDIHEIERYRNEIVIKAMSLAEPARILNKAIEIDAKSVRYRNRLREVRLERKMKQTEVVELMRKEHPRFDVPILSRMENGVCCPTPSHIVTLARIYGVNPSDLVELEIGAVAAVA